MNSPPLVSGIFKLFQLVLLNGKCFGFQRYLDFLWSFMHTLLLGGFPWLSMVPIFEWHLCLSTQSWISLSLWREKNEGKMTCWYFCFISQIYQLTRNSNTVLTCLYIECKKKKQTYDRLFPLFAKNSQHPCSVKLKPLMLPFRMIDKLIEREIAAGLCSQFASRWWLKHEKEIRYHSFSEPSIYAAAQHAVAKLSLSNTLTVLINIEFIVTQNKNEIFSHVSCIHQTDCPNTSTKAITA